MSCDEAAGFLLVGEDEDVLDGVLGEVGVGGSTKRT